MYISDDFIEVARMMHQDVHMYATTPDEILNYLLEIAPHEARPGAKRFLTEFLASNPTARQIDHMWDKSGADILFANTREFLEQLRDRL